MAVDDYSTDPNANTEVGGIDVGEGCAPGNINNAIRRIMADVADGLVQYYTQSKTNAQRLIARQNIGLGNVNNTSDANKPVSTATQTALNGKVNNNDSRLTNAREWTASTVPQAEAQAGTATTRRAWTAQRVRQAIQALAIGEGQAWVDVTASRVATSTPTKYQNTTGRSIMVSAKIEAIGTYGFRVATLPDGPGTQVTVGDGSAWVPHVFVVPPGHYYWVAISTTRPVQHWAELR